MAVDTVQTFGVWRSLVARLVRDEEVAGSNPVIPTVTETPPFRAGFLLCLVGGVAVYGGLGPTRARPGRV